MQLKMPFALVLAGLGLAVASCTTDEISVPKSELYTREFIKQFGVFDPNHDWNHSQRVNVTVTTSTPTDIKIYANVNGTRYLFGTFLGVNGSRDLGVDIPKGVSSLTLRANGTEYPVTPGAALNLDSRSRTIHPSEGESGKLEVYRAQAKNDIVKYGTYIAKYDEILPEGKGNMNRDNISLNFRFRQHEDKPIVIYPVMWNTSHTNTLGIYYTDATGVYHEQDIYTIKSGDFLRCRTYGEYDVYEDDNVIGIGAVAWLGQILDDLGFDRGKNSFTSEEKNQIVAKMVEIGCRAYDDDLSVNPEPPTIYLAGDTYNGETVPAYNVRIDGKKWTYTNNLNDNQNSLPESNKNTHTVYETSGIVVKIPVGTVYGMYIRRDDGAIRYSESTKNPDTIDYIYEYGDDGEPIKTPYDHSFNCPYAATFTRHDFDDAGTPDQVNQFRRLCFEDWLASETSDHDMNDMVFYIGGIQEEDFEEEEDPWEPEKPYEWIVAAEDLGNTDDFDFNDVVFGVGNFQLAEDGETATVDVRALASGGTLPVYLYHNGEQIGGEFHSWFGDYPSSTVINASGTASIKGKTETITVDKDFSMACCQKVDGTPNNMGGFTIKVIGKDGKEVVEIAAPNLSTNEANFAPQMICVPTHWLWPTERTHILTPYPKFGEWVSNQEACTDWHENPAGGVIVRTDIPSNTNKPENGGWNTGGNTPTPSNGTVLQQTASEVSGSSVFCTYSLSEVSEKLATATKITMHVDKSIATHFDGGTSNWDGSFFKTYGGSTQTDFVISDDKIESFKSQTNIVISFYGVDDIDKFKPVVSIEIE